MPECLVDKDGNVYHSEKSDILKDIDPSINGQSLLLTNKSHGLVIDLSAIIRSECAVIKTSDYTFLSFAEYILRKLEGMAVNLQAKMLDIVADTYQDCSIKNTTRTARGIGDILNFNELEKIPEKNKNSLNKTV